MFLHLQKSCEDGIYSSQIIHSQFPPLLTFYISVLHVTNEPTLIYYQLKSIIYSNFLCFPSVLFLFQDPLQDIPFHLFVMSPWAPLGYESFSDFSLLLMTLTLLRSSCQAFGRLFFNLDLPKYFPNDQTQVMSLWQEDQRGKMQFSLHHTVGES